MPRRTGRFRRADRLLKTADFRRVGRTGQRHGNEAFVVLIAPPRERDREGCRLGVTVSRRVGNAVVRSQVKRGVREWFRHERGGFEGPVDVVVIARPAAATLRGGEIGERLTALAALAVGTREQ